MHDHPEFPAAQGGIYAKSVKNKFKNYCIRLSMVKAFCSYTVDIVEDR